MVAAPKSVTKTAPPNPERLVVSSVFQAMRSVLRCHPIGAESDTGKSQVDVTSMDLEIGQAGRGERLYDALEAQGLAG